MKVTMGANVSEFSTSVFDRCENLDIIDIDAGNEVLGIEDGMVILKKEKKLFMVPGAKEKIRIPVDVIDIEQGALNCGMLKEVNVDPNNKIFTKDGKCVYYKKNAELATVEVKSKGEEDMLIISPKVKILSEKAMSVGIKNQKKKVIVGENVKKVSGMWMNFDCGAQTYEFKSAMPPKIHIKPI